MSTISLYETILVISTAAVFFVYHLHLYLKVHQDPLTTAIGVTNHARQMWVGGIIRDKRDILAVQTLRNQVMAATFLAFTAILISLGSFQCRFPTGRLHGSLPYAQFAGNKNRNLVDVQTDAAGHSVFRHFF